MFYRTALIICDVQKKVIPKIFNGKKVVRNIHNLMDLHNLHNQLIRKKEGENPSSIIVGEFLPDKLGKNVFNLKSGQEVKVLSKNSYSMASPELMHELESNSISNICLTGVQTEWCIYQTASHLANSGFQIDIIKDACGSTQKQEHFDALDELKNHNRIRTPTFHRWIVSRLQGADDEYNLWYLNLLNNIRNDTRKREYKAEIKEDW